MTIRDITNWKLSIKKMWIESFGQLYAQLSIFYGACTLCWMMLSRNVSKWFSYSSLRLKVQVLCFSWCVHMIHWKFQIELVAQTMALTDNLNQIWNFRWTRWMCLMFYPPSSLFPVKTFKRRFFFFVCSRSLLRLGLKFWTKLTRVISTLSSPVKAWSWRLRTTTGHPNTTQ